MNKLIILSLLAFSVSVQAKTVKIAVIDTGYDFNSNWDDAEKYGLVKPILCEKGHKDFVQREQIQTDIVVNNKIKRVTYKNTNYLVDNHGHGTHIAGLIAKYANGQDYCLIILKFYDPRAPGNNLNNTIKAFNYAINLKVDFINYSGGGTDYSELEAKYVRLALDKNIWFVAAAGNERSNIDIEKYYPAMYDKRIIAVENWHYVLDKSTDKWRIEVVSSSNYSKLGTTDGGELGEEILSLLPHNQYGKLTGTSQATAIRTGKLIKVYTNVKMLDNEHTLKVLKMLIRTA